MKRVSSAELGELLMTRLFILEENGQLDQKQLSVRQR